MTHSRSPLFHPGALVPFLLLAACSGGGGGGDPALQVRGNLTVDSVRMVTTTQQAAHEMRVAVTISATADYTDVPVAFVLLNRAEYDAKAADVHHYEVSTMVFPAVAKGSAEYIADVVIPAEARDAQDYYLVPHLDPANAIRETNEDDNEPQDGSKIEVQIGHNQTDTCDIAVVSATIETDAVILREPTTLDPTTFGIQNVENSDFSATVVVECTGTQMLPNLDIDAMVEVPGSGRMALQAWRSSASNWQSRDFTPLTPAQPGTVHCEVFIPSSTRNAIRTYLTNGGSNVFKVWFRANSASGYSQWEGGITSIGDGTTSDDEASDDVVIVLPGTVLPDPCNNLRWQTGFHEAWKNNYFGVGVDFDSNASLDEQGATAESTARVPVKLFGIASDAVSLHGLAHVLPRTGMPTDSHFLLDFSVFGVSILHEESVNPAYVYTDGRTIVKSYERNGVVFAGPVPIQLRAVATGSLGFELVGRIDPAQMTLQARAFGQLSTLAEAKVNAIIASVGVVGSVDLLNDELRAEASCALQPPANGRLQGELTLQVTNDLTGPQGRVYVYETHPEPKWCYGFVPCGVRTVRNEKTLVKFSTFTRRDVLFSKVLTSSVCL